MPLPDIFILWGWQKSNKVQVWKISESNKFQIYYLFTHTESDNEQSHTIPDTRSYSFQLSKCCVLSQKCERILSWCTSTDVLY